MINKYICCLIYIVSSLISFAQPGTIDTNYNRRSFHKTLTYFNSNIVNAVLYEEGGKILFGGEFSSSKSSRTNIFRINEDQTLDTTFLAGTSINKAINCIIKQPDGKLLVAGDFETFDGQAAGGIIRLMPNGEIDPSFILGTGATLSFGTYSTIYHIILQTDGKIILTGMFDLFDGVTRENIVRLNSDGSLDTSFDIGNMQFSPSSQLLINNALALPDGKIMICGRFGQINGVVRHSLARLNADGSLDQNFDIGNLGATFSGLALQNNKYIAYGGFDQLFFNTGMVYPKNICRFNINWEFDETFVSPVLDYTQSVTDIKVLDDQSIMAVVKSIGLIHMGVNGNQLNVSGPEKLMLANGYYDGEILCVDVNSKGEVVFGGRIDSPENSINMCDGIGFAHKDLSSDFTIHGIGLNGLINDLAILPNNSSIIVGDFQNYNGLPQRRIAKILANGRLDTSFHVGNGFAYNINGGKLTTVVSLPNGKILTGGEFETYNGEVCFNLTCLNADGTRDLSFFEGLNMSQYYPQDILVQEDGKIMVAGNGKITNNQGISRWDVIRFLASGEMDTTFNAVSDGIASGGSSGSPLSIEMQSDGKYLCGGRFFYFNKKENHGLVRLLASGEIDTSFHIGQGFRESPFDDNEVSVVKIQPNGKILVGGEFALYDTIAKNSFVRLNQDGSIDTTLFEGLGEINAIYDIKLQPDGKILLAGSFVSYGGTPVKYLVQLNQDGTLKMAFPEINNSPQAIDLQSDGKILVGGYGNSNSNFTQLGLFLLNNELDYLKPLDISLQSQTELNCQQNGTATIVPINGIPPFTYSWNNEAPSNDPTLTYSDRGIYKATITDSTGASKSVSTYWEGPVVGGAGLSTNLVPSTFRAGFTGNLMFDTYNKSCTPISGKLIVKLDSQLTYLSSNPTPNYISNDTLIWDFANLVYQQDHFICDVQVKTSAAANIGDSILINLKATPIAGDVDSINNIRNYIFPVIKGFDPNDKKVYPLGECIPHFIKPSEKLTYTIRFQNTGNSEAINIVVEDQLDADLDLSTLEIIGHSHPMITEIDARNRLKFIFDNIYLPDSTSNESASHGYVIFEIIPSMNAINGSEINNTAEIYFDFNDPIITNTVSQTISNIDHSSSLTSVQLTVCDSILWNNNYYTQAGTYVIHKQNIYGCDSTVQLDLTVNYATDTLINLVVLDSIEINGIIYKQSGTYFQQFTNSAGCTETWTIQLLVNTSVGIKQNENSSFKIYPNPFEDNLTVEIKNSGNENHYQILNTQGVLISDWNKINNNVEIIDLKELAIGIYYIKLKIGTQQSIIRITKIM